MDVAPRREGGGGLRRRQDNQRKQVRVAGRRRCGRGEEKEQSGPAGTRRRAAVAARGEPVASGNRKEQGKFPRRPTSRSRMRPRGDRHGPHSPGTSQGTLEEGPGRSDKEGALSRDV